MLIRQRDRTDCGAACLASICAYYGLHVAVSRIRQLAGTDHSGTSILGIIEAAEGLGLEAKGIRSTFEYLDDANMPAIVHVLLKNHNTHFVVLIRKLGNNVIIMDPAEGVYKELTHYEFLEMWTGASVIIQPGGTFQPNEKSSVVGRITNIMRCHQKQLTLSAALAVLLSCAGVSISIYVKELVDAVAVSRDIGALNLLSCGMLIVITAQFSMALLKNRLILNTGKTINSSLVTNYCRHVLNLPQSFFDTMRVGEMISRINDALKITSLVNDIAMNVLVDLLSIVFALSFMFWYNSKLAFVILLLLPIYLLLYYISDRIHTAWQRKVAESGASLDSTLVETFNGASTIKRLSLEEFFYKRAELNVRDVMQSVYSMSLRHGRLQTSAEFITRFFTLLLLWAGTYNIIEGTLTTGELMSFYTLLGFFAAPVLYLLSASRNIRETMIAAERLFEITDLETEKQGAKTLGRLRRENLVVRFNNVSFRYGSNEPVLKDCCLKIESGTITGIKGESGCGKSTIASLLMRIYYPSAGTITIDNMDLRKIDRHEIRKLVSIVPQHTHLFSGTIEDNITIGMSYDEARLTEICKKVGITDFACLMPYGLKTTIGENGSNLSGGQRQKISIARALYRAPGILIMDEATSSLDPDSAEKVMQTIDWYKNNGNAVIIIAHDDASLKNCDNIVVLRNGVLI